MAANRREDEAKRKEKDLAEREKKLERERKDLERAAEARQRKETGKRKPRDGTGRSWPLTPGMNLLSQRNAPKDMTKGSQITLTNIKHTKRTRKCLNHPMRGACPEASPPLTGRVGASL